MSMCRRWRRIKMGNTLLGKIIYFWVFIIGALIFGRLFGLTGKTDTVFLLLASAAVYWLVALMRYFSHKRAEKKKQER